MSQLMKPSKQPQSISTIHREIDRIHAGLTFRSVENLQKALAIPMDQLAAVLGVSRATLHRRKLQGRLEERESERLVRYERLLKTASDVFGDADDARRWM